MNGCGKTLGWELDGTGLICGGRPRKTPVLCSFCWGMTEDGQRAERARQVAPGPSTMAVAVNLGSLEWDLRIGIAIRNELIDGWGWRSKDGVPCTPMTFSEALLREAGGIRRFLAEWEPDPRSPLALGKR